MERFWDEEGKVRGEVLFKPELSRGTVVEHVRDDQDCSEKYCAPRDRELKRNKKSTSSAFCSFHTLTLYNFHLEFSLIPNHNLMCCSFICG